MFDSPSDAEDREAIVKSLSSTLKSGLSLQLLLYFSHWNIKGFGFPALHPFLGSLAGSIEDWNDKIAERIVTLGGIAPVEVIPVKGVDALDDHSIVQVVCVGVEDYLSSLKSSCNSIKDEYTKQLLMDAVLEWEKWDWQLLASLENS